MATFIHCPFVVGLLRAFYSIPRQSKQDVDTTGVQCKAAGSTCSATGTDNIGANTAVLGTSMVRFDSFDWIHSLLLLYVRVASRTNRSSGWIT